MPEQQLTFGPDGKILTNSNIWSPNGDWIVFDTRPDAEGSVFEGTQIRAVHVQNGAVKTLYQAPADVHCGVASWHPHQDKIVFILGPQNPTNDWQYGPAHRRGVIVDNAEPRQLINLDARDLTCQTPGALAGGSHLHLWHSRGDWISSTYHDALHDSELRHIIVSVPQKVVVPPGLHQHNGAYFSAIVTQVVAEPRPGSDEIKRACEESWIGNNGYLKTDGTLQKRALAFQGEVVTTEGESIREVFIVDLPDDLTQNGATQRRLTFSAEQKYPGLQGPRHWLKTSPDGANIAFLMRDDNGVVQLWTISPNGGERQQVTRDNWNIASAFSWSGDGNFIAYAADNSIFAADCKSGQSYRLTPRDEENEILPLACVFAPGGRSIAYQRRVADENGARANQIFVVDFRPEQLL